MGWINDVRYYVCRTDLIEYNEPRYNRIIFLHIRLHWIHWPTISYVYRSDLIEYNKLTKSNAAHNLNNAFDVAEEKLGLAPLLDVQGTVEIIIFT